MAQRSHVPKFGNWDSGESVPYTAYFDKARKTRGGKMINPNDPEENPDMLSEYEAPTSAPTSAPPSKTMSEPEKPPLGQGAVRARRSEDSDPKQFRNSPAHQDDSSHRAAAESTHQRQGRVATSVEAYKRPIRQSAGSENSFERSPLHNQARVAGRGNGDQSPSWEGKGLYKNSQGTPGRSRLRPNSRGDESPERGAAVPKFGEWDENNPASADGYTHIFNKVREERNSGAKTPNMTSPAPYYSQKPSSNDSVKSCCFPWGRK